MPQCDFTKDKADFVASYVAKIYSALPNAKQPALLGHLIEILLFLEAAKAAAPK